MFTSLTTKYSKIMVQKELKHLSLTEIMFTSFTIKYSKIMVHKELIDDTVWPTPES